MSKEYLEALHTIAFNTQFIAGINFGNELRTIEKALQRLESIDNTNPSEALENLRCLANVSYDTDNIDEEQYEEYLKDYNTIKQALIKSQEQEKVLEIVVEKEVDITFLKSAITFDEYNKLIKFKNFFAIALTQEEFDLLKRCCDE